MSDYKRQKFQSGVLQNTQNNFARFDKAVRLREELRQKTAEKNRANQGAFTPDTLTTEVNQKFGSVKQQLQSLVTDKGLKNAKFLDKKSDYYDNAVEANYNATKQGAVDGLLAMNRAMTAYQTYMAAYKEDSLNFNQEEYEDIQNRWSKVNDFVSNPGRLGYDDNGNISVAVYNEETEKDEQVPLAQWDVLNFENALKPVANPDYTENFITYLGSNPGGRENENFLGMVSDYIEETYGADLPGADDMALSDRYQQEAIDNAIMFAKNRKTEGSTSSGTTKKPATSDDVDKLLKIPSAVLSPLEKDREGNLKTDEELRKYIKDKIARGTAETYPDEFRTFMDTQGFRGKEYTAQDLEDAWVAYTKDTMVGAYEDPNVASAVAGGVTEQYQDKVVKGGVTKQMPSAVPVSSIGQSAGRYNTDDKTFEKKNNAHYISLTDPTGMGHFAYDLEGSGTAEGSNFFSVTTNITPFNGAIQIGLVGNTKADGSGDIDSSFPHEQAGAVTFTPSQILNNVPMLSKDFNFERFSKIGKRRWNYVGYEAEGKVPGYNLKPGAILTDDLVSMIKAKYPKKWKQYVKFAPAAKGVSKFSDDRGKNEREMLIPLSQIQAQLQANTGHNFANMTDPNYNLKDMSQSELLNIMGSDMVSSEYKAEAERLHNEMLGL